MKLSFLIIYAVLMCGLTVRSFFKKKNNIYCSLWIAYSVSAVFCVLCKLYQKDLVGIGYSQNMWYDLSDTTLWGYLLIVLCCLIAFRPFALFDKNNKLVEFGSSKGAKQFFKLYAFGYILCAVIFILLSINTVISLLNIRNFGVIRLSLYSNGENESNFIMTTNFVANVCYKLCLQFKYLSVFVALAMFKEKVSTRLATGLLLSTFFVYYLYANGNAARGGLLIFIFCIMLIGICFFKYMSKNNKRKLLIIVAAIFGVVMSFFIAVTVSRFGNDHGGGNPILRNICFYLGHGPIEFSKITGSLNDFAYGKTIIGRLLNHYFGTPYSWESVQAEIGYPSIGPVFVTYLGYLYTDFGSIGCILFVTLWSQFICRLLRKSPNRISTIFLFLYYLSYFVTGIFAVGRLEYAALITAHLIFFAIRLIEDILKANSSKYSYRYNSYYYQQK